MLLSTCTLIASGCGSASPQTAHEPKATYTMQVLRAKFPVKQSIAAQTMLELTVRNASSETVPERRRYARLPAVRRKLSRTLGQQTPDLGRRTGTGSDRQPPVQTEEVASPGGGETAYVNTWALGPLASGAVKTFRWMLTPVKSGLHVVHYTVAAGLGGNAKAALASGAPVKGRFVAYVTPAPPASHVNPNTGQVQPGEYPTAPGSAP